MLSISPLAKSASGVSGVSNYYLHEDNSLFISAVARAEQEGRTGCYQQAQETQTSAKWYGKLAQEKGLCGQAVDPTTLIGVLRGDIGQESVVLKRANRLIGYDLTFSAPKAVSVLALVGGDKRLIEAHAQAVKFALSEIEKGAAQARVKHPMTGGMQYHNTKNLIFALVQHQTSREADPQLHTHSLMANITRDLNHQLRALASCTHQTSAEIQGTLARIYNHQKYYTSLYQSQLSRCAQVLGYETAGQGQNLFDIKGLPPELLQRFSTRSQQIKAQIDTFGCDSQATKEVATKSTRKPKQDIREEHLQCQWQQKAQDFDLQGFIERAKNKEIQPPLKTNLNPRALAAIDRAVSSLHHVSPHFSYEKVILQALADSTRGEPVDAIDLKRAVDFHINHQVMIRVSKDRTLYTTKAALDQAKTYLEAPQKRPTVEELKHTDQHLLQSQINTMISQKRLEDHLFQERHDLACKASAPKEQALK